MLKIHSVKTDEDLEIVKGLLEEYLASLFELDGPVHIKEVEAHKHQMNNLGEYFRPPEGCLLDRTPQPFALITVVPCRCVSRNFGPVPPPNQTALSRQQSTPKTPPFSRVPKHQNSSKSHIFQKLENTVISK